MHLQLKLWFFYRETLYQWWNYRGKKGEVFAVYDSVTNSSTKLADMITARYSHSMLYHEDSIYAVGGNTNACEKYDLKTMKWTKLPSLICEERISPILFINGNFLYAFFGLINGEYSDSVERINIQNTRSKWEILPCNKSDLNLKFIGGGIIEENDKEIYIFGGKSNEGLKKNTVKFNFSNSTFFPTDIALDEGTYFHEFMLIKLDETSYGQFNSDKYDNFLKIQLG